MYAGRESSKKYLEVILGCVQSLNYWKSQHEEHELKSKLPDKQESDVHMRVKFSFFSWRNFLRIPGTKTAPQAFDGDKFRI